MAGERRGANPCSTATGTGLYALLPAGLGKAPLRLLPSPAAAQRYRLQLLLRAEPQVSLRTTARPSEY